MKVTDPRGRTWRVSRRWMPWRRRSRVGDVTSRLPNLGDDPVSAVLGLVLLPLYLLALLMMLVVLLEKLAQLLVLPFALVARLLGTPWHVQAREGWAHAFETPAGDWERSGRAVAQIAEGLRRGLTPWQSADPAGLPR